MTIEDEAPAGVPEWFVTFADMMSLLLAFFIMLVSMSSFQEPKQFQSMIATIREQFGHNPSRGELETNLVVAADADNLPDVPTKGDTRPGGIIYFANLATELTETNKRDLFQIVRQLHECDANIEIRGHAARVTLDPKSGLRDLWDLAERRCRTTMEFMIEQGVDPSRIRLANSGASEPLYNGADALRLRENSRVEVRVLSEGMDGL